MFQAVPVAARAAEHSPRTIAAKTAATLEYSDIDIALALPMSRVAKEDWLRRLNEYRHANTVSGDGACPLLRRTTGVPRKKGDRHRGDDVSPNTVSVCATEPVPLFPLT